MGFGEGEGGLFQKAPFPLPNLSAIRGAEGFLDRVEGGGVVLFKAGEGPDGEHEHLEIESHLGAPVIDGASLAVQGNAVGPAAALLPLAGHDGINMLAGFRGIKLLAC